MGEKNDGGPAFPLHTEWDGGRGMTLRDWFAGQALGGCLAGNPSFDPNDTPDQVRQHIARNCYLMADAMLAAQGAP